MITEQDAFRIGFIYKLAESKANPYDINDAIEVVEKTASVLLPLAIGTSVLLPAVLETLLKGGVGIPSSVGSIAGTGLANAQAAAVDPDPDEAMKQKILSDYKAQIRKAKVEKNNDLISAVVKNRKQQKH